MKKLLLITLTLYCACTAADQKEESASAVRDINNDQKAGIDQEEPDMVTNDERQNLLLSFFPQYSTDSAMVEVSDNTRNGRVRHVDYIPSSFQDYFDGFLYPTSSTSTGAKPLGRLKIGKDKHLLTLLQLDDYGPVYYGLTYDEKADKIVSKEVIAQEWSDAGYTQVIYSNILYKDGQLQITKQIKTCHADMDSMGIDPEDTEVVCYDSTATVVVNKQLNFEKIL